MDEMSTDKEELTSGSNSKDCMEVEKPEEVVISTECANSCEMEESNMCEESGTADKDLFLKPFSHTSKLDSSIKEHKLSDEIPYKEPSWSGRPESEYYLEVLRGGVFMENIALDKSYVVLGRSENCDIKLANPLASRYHCVIQYKTNTTRDNPPGMYLYDLGSTHGTYHNKRRLSARSYSRFRVGHMVKFCRSERLYILHGPKQDEEQESAYSVTELMQMASIKKAEMANEDSKKHPLQESTTKEVDVTWGMAEDAREEDEEQEENWSVNPFSCAEELNLDDPKKTLRGWFEREGYDPPEYKLTEISCGFYKCQIEIRLPWGGEPLMCSVEHKGKKKDTTIQAALQACRLIHEEGLLKQATHDPLSTKHTKDWKENDYFDSDEDEFLDRTGTIAAKRHKRKMATQSSDHVETLESLEEKYASIIQHLVEVEENLEEVQLAKCKYRSHPISEDIDDFVKLLQPKNHDKHQIASWKLEWTKLSKEEDKVRNMLNAVKPSHVAEFQPRKSTLKRAAHLFTKPPVKTTKRKVVDIKDVFGSEEEEPKLKLTKLDSDEGREVKAVPYGQTANSVPRIHNLLVRRQNIMKESVVSAAEPSSTPQQSTLASQVKEDEVRMPNDPQILSANRLQCTSLANEADCEKECEVKDDTHVFALPQSIQQHSSQRPTSLQEKSLEFAKPGVVGSQKKHRRSKADLCSFDKQYENWIPPSGQTGDGRTSLNDKLGY